MLRVSRRYELARLIEKWHKNNCMPICPAATLYYLQLNGLLDESKVYEFLNEQKQNKTKNRQKKEQAQ